jgi:hypothetical protein
MKKAVLVAVALLLSMAPAQAQNKPADGAGKADREEKVGVSIKDFYGRFAGRGVTKSHGALHYGLTDRDLDVRIEAAPNNGFKLTWTTIRRKRNKAKRLTTQTVEFVPAGTPNRWTSKDSGQLLSGKPVIWARLAGARLFVYVVTTDAKTGRFHAAVYVRELVQDGMQLRFRRVRDGAPARAVIAFLRRVK